MSPTEPDQGDQEHERYLTAEEALFETERAVAGLGGGGMIGRLNQPEALKLAEALFGDEEMPEEIRAFFSPSES